MSLYTIEFSSEESESESTHESEPVVEEEEVEESEEETEQEIIINKAKNSNIIVRPPVRAKEIVKQRRPVQKSPEKDTPEIVQQPKSYPTTIFNEATQHPKHYSSSAGLQMKKTTIFSHTDLDSNITLRITREYRLGIKGRAANYFIYNNDVLMYTAHRPPRSSSVEILCVNDKKIEYKLLIGNEDRDFSLRKGGLGGAELMTANFKHKDGITRKIKVCFFENGDTRITQEIKSRNPTLDNEGRPFLDFGGRYYIPSAKNAILYVTDDRSDSLVIRKTAKNTLEMESKLSSDPIYPSALLLANHISKIK